MTIATQVLSSRAINAPVRAVCARWAERAWNEGLRIGCPDRGTRANLKHRKSSYQDDGAMISSSTYLLGAVSDPQLLKQLSGLVTSDRQNLATLLAPLGEVEARRLHLPAACSSMFTFAVQVLGFSEDE